MSKFEKKQLDEEYPDEIPCVRCLRPAQIRPGPKYYCEECDIYFTKDGKVMLEPEECETVLLTNYEWRIVQQTLKILINAFKQKSNPDFAGSWQKFLNWQKDLQAKLPPILAKFSESKEEREN